MSTADAPEFTKFFAPVASLLLKPTTSLSSYTLGLKSTHSLNSNLPFDGLSNEGMSA